MASDRPENGHADVDNHTGQQDPRQAYGGSPMNGMPTMQDPGMTQTVNSQQMGPPYGLQAVAPAQAQSGQDPMGSTTLAVTNLPYRIRWQDLKDLFRRYGTPSRADVFLAPDGRSRGVGMVSMRTRREAENCVNDLNGYEWFGRKIGVKIDETGGHHALAAAAMAGATIWEGVGISPPDYEVRDPFACRPVLLLILFGSAPCLKAWLRVTHTGCCQASFPPDTAAGGCPHVASSWG